MPPLSAQRKVIAAFDAIETRMEKWGVLEKMDSLLN